ncbi:M20/M25/M40 family metallo-hydrolase, partial [Psychrobacter sp.]|uniref:M20/M25/M40 family metallo-hydrolase n=1 Tax=Psychrobacter sp. TaxID=56811 RepID=UPI0025D1544B
QINSYPGLLTTINQHEKEKIQKLLPSLSQFTKISFGTEGGLFQNYFDSPIFVCGPGSIDVAHKPNEYIAIDQLNACSSFLNKLIHTLL